MLDLLCKVRGVASFFFLQRYVELIRLISRFLSILQVNNCKSLDILCAGIRSVNEKVRLVVLNQI
jgi:hypothetical protein